MPRLHQLTLALCPDLLGHTVREPAEKLSPERLVGLVFERDVGVHLPDPGVLDWQHDHLAAAITMEREHHLALPVLFRTTSQERSCTGLEACDGVQGGDGREGFPPLDDRIAVFGSELRSRVSKTVSRRRDEELVEVGPAPRAQFVVQKDG